MVWRRDPFWIYRMDHLEGPAQAPIARSAAATGSRSPGAASRRLPRASARCSKACSPPVSLMEEVFGQLAEEGFLERAVGRGTFVAARATRLVTPPKPAGARRRSPAPSRRGLGFVAPG
jgi:hypothetical protein